MTPEALLGAVVAEAVLALTFEVRLFNANIFEALVTGSGASVLGIVVVEVATDFALVFITFDQVGLAAKVCMSTTHKDT